MNFLDHDCDTDHGHAAEALSRRAFLGGSLGSLMGLLLAPRLPLLSAAESAATGMNPFTQWYEVKKGDTLWKIAKEHYGDGNLYPEIFKANQDVLSDPDKIQVGQKLRIP